MSATPARRGAAALAWIAAGLILVATLRPERHSPLLVETFGHWCLVCGRLGGADAIQNVILFLPLGAGLALAGASLRVAAAVAFALSLSVELIQLAALTGRYATIGDVVTNTVGGWLGALVAGSWRAWVTPSRRGAGGLAGAAAGVWLAVLAVATWAFDRAPADGASPPRIGDLPTPPAMGWFSGFVEEARFGSLDVSLRVSHRGTGAVVIGSAAGRSVEGAVRVTGSDPRPFAVPMLYVHGVRDSQPELVIGQDDEAAMVRTELRAGVLRLRQPSLRVPGVFPPTGSASDGVRRVIEGGFSNGTYRLAVSAGGGVRARTLPLSAVHGWALLLPYVRIDGAESAVVTALWLGAFLVPFGYWLRWAARPTVAAAVGVGVASAGLVALPALAGAPGPPGWVLIAAPLAIAAGSALSIPFHRRASRASFPP